MPSLTLRRLRSGFVAGRSQSPPRPARESTNAELNVSTSGYYAWRKRPESAHDREDVRIGVLVEEAHVRSRATYGSPRVHEVLRSKGLRVIRKRIIRLMKALGLRGRKPRAFVRTTESVPGAEAAPDLIGRDFTAVAPNLKWVGDVTYLRTPEGWNYLAVLLNLYSCRVGGWALSPVNDRKLALRVLRAAILVRQPAPGWIHHADRGSPYPSEDYQKALEGAKARPSNSRGDRKLERDAPSQTRRGVRELRSCPAQPVRMDRGFLQPGPHPLGERASQPGRVRARGLRDSPPQHDRGIQ